MRRIESREFADGIRGASVTSSALKPENIVSKIFVEADGVQIKIEVTPVLRGCVYEPEDRCRLTVGRRRVRLCRNPGRELRRPLRAASSSRRSTGSIRAISSTSATFSRMRESATSLRKAFIVYILSHNRPMAEVLAPTRLDIAQEFARGFEGMTETPVTLDDLLQAREEFIAELVGKMPEDHKRFLVSLKKGEPEWALLDIQDAEKLPAVRWRLQNLAKLDKPKRAALIDGLRQVLEL